MTIDELLEDIAYLQSVRDAFDVGSLGWESANEELGDLFRQLAEAAEGKS